MFKSFQTSDPQLSVRCQKLEAAKKSVLHNSSATKLLFFLRMMPNGVRFRIPVPHGLPQPLVLSGIICDKFPPNGVQHMSSDIQGLVETSLNAGIMKLTEDVFSVNFSVRSSVTTRKYELNDSKHSILCQAGKSHLLSLFESLLRNGLPKAH